MADFDFVKVEWLYGKKWTAVRVHFASLRYLPFVAIALAIPSELPTLFDVAGGSEDWSI